MQSAQNRFWLLVPVLVLNLALVGRLPPPLAPGSPGPDIPGWLSLSETVLRVMVFGVPLSMPFSLPIPGTRALAWTSILLFTGIGLRSTLRFFPDTGRGCTWAPRPSL